MTVIAAVVIGGTSTFGGIGTIFGTVIGVLFTNMLSNAMTILKISLYWQTLVIGLILVFAVAVDGYKRSKSKAS
jgi:ribose transport system permease protein